ncbi:MAG: hypothetical protein LUD69_02980 [Oscillospiraceae bacterium]|nr:hypothetical protein [Oscillospiraceae bacterium]
MKGPYDDIIHLPHHVSPTRPPMPMSDRAAQFSPFAALTGYHGVIVETGRLTEQKRELEADERAELDRKQQYLASRRAEHPPLLVTYFVPDGRKAGGAYVTVTGRLKGLDEARRLLLLEGGAEIPMEDISALDSPIFQDIEN